MTTLQKTQLKDIMAIAHIYIKKLEGDYQAKMKMALQMAWEESKQALQKAAEYVVTEIAELKKDVKKVFNALKNVRYNGWKAEYRGDAEEVLSIVAKNSAGFQGDIANRALYEGMMMSEKQAWCVAFEFQKVA